MSEKERERGKGKQENEGQFFISRDLRNETKENRKMLALPMRKSQSDDNRAFYLQFDPTSEG